MAEPTKDAITEVLVKLAELSTKMDNFTKAHDTQATQIEKKADAADMNRRWAAQSKFNFFIGSSAVSAVIGFLGIIGKHLLGS